MHASSTPSLFVPYCWDALIWEKYRVEDSALEFWNSSILQEAFEFPSVCAWLARYTALSLCKSLVYYGRLLLHRLGIPGGQACMSATGCVSGSLAAGLSTAQGT